jgi:hypothetical protein
LILQEEVSCVIGFVRTLLTFAFDVLAATLAALAGIAVTVVSAAFLLAGATFGLGAVFLAVTSVANPDGPDLAQTHLARSLETAEYIREALAEPMRVPPLPPITESVARGYILAGHPWGEIRRSRPVRHASPDPDEAMDAMAMDIADTEAPAGAGYAAMRKYYPKFHRHKVY